MDYDSPESLRGNSFSDDEVINDGPRVPIPADDIDGGLFNP